MLQLLLILSFPRSLSFFASSGQASTTKVSFKLATLHDVSISPDAWTASANYTTRPIDVLYNLVWPPGSSDNGSALAKLATLAKIYAYLQANAGVLAVVVLGTILLCCVLVCGCCIVVRKRAAGAYNVLDMSTSGGNLSPNMDNSRSGLNEGSNSSPPIGDDDHSTCSCLSPPVLSSPPSSITCSP